MQAVDFERLEQVAGRERDAFASAEPFPHVVVDDFLPVETARAVHAEFERSEAGWKHYKHYNERKYALTDVGQMLPATRALFEALQSERFVRLIERLTGIEGLLSDPDLDGAGMHRSARGGFLNLHVDFLSHTKHRHWSRQVNLLLYLNPDWREDWGGELELWDRELTRCVRKVAPLFNRCVIFHTCAGSYHGHPTPLACPEGVTRKSIALYYFRDEGQALQLSSTDYRGRPDDSLLRRALIRADRGLLHLYSFLKRYTPIDDRLVSRILKRF
jgi:Rps23 Pro-64 3,4-dihydroxylase Tpa1-like proline 4-hydroxylase